MADAADITSFKARFVEFKPAPDALVGTYLDEAESTLGVIWTGTKRARGKQWLAAHLLSLSPNARDMALTSDDGSSIYEREFRRVQASVTAGRRCYVPSG